jgi:hypothetical protein
MPIASPFRAHWLALRRARSGPQATVLGWPILGFGVYGMKKGEGGAMRVPVLPMWVFSSPWAGGFPLMSYYVPLWIDCSLHTYTAHTARFACS